MKDEIKEIYLSNENSKFIGTHDNMGCATIHGILTKNITYEEYVDIISKTKYFLLVDKDYITNLQEENERLKEKNYLLIDYQDMEIRYNDYKSRNKKAIEYITSEETINMFSSINAREKWLKINHKLLKILQGGDKDDK